MDGNGRWAAARGLPRIEGHRRGAERLIEIVDACVDLGISTLTVFAFSAENWKRPTEEISGLFKLGEWVLRVHLSRLQRRNVKLRVIGRQQQLRRGLAEQQRATDHQRVL